MTKLPVVSGRKIINRLFKAGFNISRSKGSHFVLIKFIDNKKLIVVVPLHKKIDPGTLISIIAQSNMTKEEFLDFL